MFSAISGLRNHQTMMDVVGNNISNVNTTGFKSSSVVFQDVLSQTLRGAGAPASQIGGTNPAQVGLGSMVGAITTSFAQGALQRTGRATDVAVQGDGFFNVVQAGQQLYTRAGSFSIDAEGRLVTQEGGFVQGWTADGSGNIDTNAAVGDITIPVGSLLPPKTTTNVRIGGNLPADAPLSPATGSVIVNSVEVYDNEGNAVNMSFTFTHTAADTWTAEVATTPGGGALVTAAGPPPTTGPVTLTFDSSGELTSGDLTVTGVPNAGDMTIDLGDPNVPGRLTQYSEVNSVAVQSQDGYGAGSLQSFSTSQEGLLVGAYSNGQNRPIGQLALTVFNNPEGLERVGGSNFRATVNSGLAQTGTAGLGGRGLLSTGTVEMSNVDLAQEFTNLIIAQRGFQANSRVVTSADELLNEIVNLKR
jgi:flagellar hook protein FlgE